MAKDLSANRFKTLAAVSLRLGLRKIGLEVGRLRNANIEEQVVKKALQLTKPDVVVDVGANSGQFAELVMACGFEGKVISFEAVPEIYRELQRRAGRGTSNWKIGRCTAVGAQDGEIDINVAGNLASSSVLPMLKRHVEAAPQSAYSGSVRVPLSRLDSLVGSDIPQKGEVFLKVDTQGYELQVLRGGEELLKRVTALQVELSTMPLYDGAPSLLEMLLYIDERGFKIFGMVPELFSRATGQLLQVNGVFVRADTV